MLKEYIAYRHLVSIAHHRFPHKKVKPSHAVKHLHDGFLYEPDVHMAVLHYSIPGDKSGHCDHINI